MRELGQNKEFMKNRQRVKNFWSALFDRIWYDNFAFIERAITLLEHKKNKLQSYLYNKMYILTNNRPFILFNQYYLINCLLLVVI